MRHSPATQTCTQALLHHHLDLHWSSSHLNEMNAIDVIGSSIYIWPLNHHKQAFLTVLYHTWRWFIHEVDLQLVFALLAQQRLVLVQLLLLVILSPQVSLKCAIVRRKIHQKWRDSPEQLVHSHAFSGPAKDVSDCPSKRDGRISCTCNCCSPSPSWREAILWNRTELVSQEGRSL